MEYLAKNSKNSLRLSRWTLDNECIIAQLAIWNFDDTGHPLVRWMRDGLFQCCIPTSGLISVFMPIPRLERAFPGSALASCSLNWMFSDIVAAH